MPMFTSQKGVDAPAGRLFAVVSEMPSSRLIALALAAAAAGAAEAPAKLAPRSVWVVSLTEENDKFAPSNKDRYYTQGLKVAINRGDHTFFSLTQEINTPSDTLSPNPSLDDMPYSGALYLGWGYGAILDRGGRKDCLFSVEAKLGVIGPAAGGQTVQNKFHELINTPPSAGWENQVPNELLVNIDGEFRRRFDLDPTGHGYRDLIARANAPGPCCSDNIGSGHTSLTTDSSGRGSRLRSMATSRSSHSCIVDGAPAGTMTAAESLRSSSVRGVAEISRTQCVSSI